MQTNNDRISMQELTKLVENSLICSAKEAERIAKATNTPLVSLDDTYQPHQRADENIDPKQSIQD